MSTRSIVLASSSVLSAFVLAMPIAAQGATAVSYGGGCDDQVLRHRTDRRAAAYDRDSGNRLQRPLRRDPGGAGPCADQ
ncbi:MAG TPA: hypothetical protein VFZ65_22420 [Planctomycetota bacterium]|nr:hypothetical protein [Planctomycetota bacterium]